GLDLRNFAGRRRFRHEDARSYPEFTSGEGDRGAVVAARGRGAACRRRRPGEKIVKGAARLERTGCLQTLELERQRGRLGQGGGRLENRRAADARSDPCVGGSDVGGRDGCCHGEPPAPSLLWVFLGSVARTIA